MKTNFKTHVILSLLISISSIGNAQEMKLSLEEALKLVKQNNKSLQVQHLQEEISTEATNEARGNLLPSLYAIGSYTRYFDRQVIFMPGSFAGSEVKPVVDVAVGGLNAINAGFFFQQPLINEAARRQIKTAKLGSSLEVQKSRDLQSQLVIEVSTDYYTLQLLNASILLHVQSLNRNAQALDDSRQLFRQGKNLKIDTLRNFIAVENLRSTLLYLENQKEVTELQLKNKLGISHSVQIEIVDDLLAESEAYYFNAAENSFEEAIGNRTDIRLQKIIIDREKSRWAQARAQRIPSLSLVASYQFQAQADNFEPVNYAWPRTSYVGIHARVPVFSGNQLNARIRQSRLQVRQNEMAMQQLTDLAKTEVVSLQSKLKEIIRQTELQKRTVEAAELGFVMTSERYKNGLSSRLEQTDAELALTQAKLLQLQAIYNLKVTALEYQRALGLLD